MKYVDLTNQKFNRLTVLERDQKKCNRVMWKCRCDCGNIISVSTNSLKSGNSKSCGCYKLESFTKITTKHHLSNTRIYNIWKDMAVVELLFVMIGKTILCHFIIGL